MKNIILALFVLLFSAGCSDAASEILTGQQETKISNVYYSNSISVAGTLRQNENDPTLWCWIDNNDHTPTGVDSSICGVASGNKIKFHYGVTYKKVITMIVQPDEMYTQNLDMRIGVSVGTSLSIISVTSFGAPIDVDRWLGYNSGNIWIYGKFEM